MLLGSTAVYITRAMRGLHKLTIKAVQKKKVRGQTAGSRRNRVNIDRSRMEN
jgi:hypothetical protein